MQLKFRILIVGTLSLLTLIFSCQSGDKNIFSFDQSGCVAFNVFKKTQGQPTTGHTYIFKRNGEFYSLEYNIGDSLRKIRHAEIKDFCKPNSWKVRDGSILIENEYYNFRIKSKNEIILSKKNYDTLWLKKISENFDIEFYVRKPSFIYTVNSSGDTIRRTELKNL